MSSPIWALWYQFPVQTFLSGQFLSSCLAASSSANSSPIVEFFSCMGSLPSCQCYPPGMQLSPTWLRMSASIPYWNPGLHCSLWWPVSWMPLCCLSLYLGTSLSHAFFSLLLDRRFIPIQTFQHLIFAIKWRGSKCHLTQIRILRTNQYYKADLQSPSRSAGLLIYYTLHSSRKGVLEAASNKYLRKEWVEKHMQRDTKS